ncbi:hypothetical protein [Sorangium sp. So ce887]
MSRTSFETVSDRARSRRPAGHEGGDWATDDWATRDGAPGRPFRKI